MGPAQFKKKSSPKGSFSVDQLAVSAEQQKKVCQTKN